MSHHPLRQKPEAAFARLDRDGIGGAYAALALAALALAEGLKLGERGKLQGSLLLAIACVVAFGIWHLLHVPASIAALLHPLFTLLGRQG